MLLQNVKNIHLGDWKLGRSVNDPNFLYLYFELLCAQSYNPAIFYLDKWSKMSINIQNQTLGTFISAPLSQTLPEAMDILKYDNILQ